MAKRRKDEELGRMLSKNFVNNRKYITQTKRAGDGQKNDFSRIKDGADRMLTKKDEVLGRWREYFKDLMTS